MDVIGRSRDVRAWVTQVRRTARLLAEHPIGGSDEVPTDIKWIVPIVCSEGLEVDWLQPEDAYLVPKKVSIL